MRYLPHLERISISSLPFSVHDGEQAIDKNNRKILTRVSSDADVPCPRTDDVVRNNCAGNHSESSSGSIPSENRSSFITRYDCTKWKNCWKNLRQILIFN